MRAIGSTGAPLSPAAATWASTAAGAGVQVCSISGGTDVCTAFVGQPGVAGAGRGAVVPHAGGARWRRGTPPGTRWWEQGELVVTAPMPSMPVGLWGDPDGARLRAAYFDQHPGVWTHGDWITIHHDGSCTITGRSDATLNRGGVRLGSAEIYEVLEELPQVEDSLVVHLEDGDQLVLLVVVVDGAAVDDALRSAIRGALRSSLSPRHAPDRIEGVRSIPRTLSGKRVEVPVKRILQGADPDSVVSRDTLRDPSAIDDVVALVGP